MTSSPYYSFSAWRDKAKYLLLQGTIPSPELWEDRPLFSSLPLASRKIDKEIRISREFLAIAETVCAFRNPRALHLLYKVAWRITSGERRLLENPIDQDILEIRRMERAVRKDIHKMHAFVRFKCVHDECGDLYQAWHRPDHTIVRLAVPFFVRRFGAMRWTIMTPDETAVWDGETLSYAAGEPTNSLPVDPYEETWKTYYGATFNPARVRLRAMKAEMPVRHWPTMPETSIIPHLLESVEQRLDTMEKNAPRSARPSQHRSIESLKEEAACCKGCPLFSRATQTVFGIGPATAKIVLIGEQPGDEEDKYGIPFVGPAGKILDEAMREAGIDRATVYLTNAVKHFKWEERGKRRLHKRPSGNEIVACRPWLAEELKLLNPQVIVCLGTTAAQAILGRTVKIATSRMQPRVRIDDSEVIVTYHPSSILRALDERTIEQFRTALVSDLNVAVKLITNSNRSRD